MGIPVGVIAQPRRPVRASGMEMPSWPAAPYIDDGLGNVDNVIRGSKPLEPGGEGCQPSRSRQPSPSQPPSSRAATSSRTFVGVDRALCRLRYASAANMLASLSEHPGFCKERPCFWRSKSRRSKNHDTPRSVCYTGA
jgi:hypothetical protein